MISSQEVANRIRFGLDAEGDDHYGDIEDLVPAINLAKDWIVSVINDALGQRKLGEEVFREIHTSKVLRTSKDSRFNLNILSDDVWTITGIIVLPSTGTNGSSAPLMPNDYQAYERTDLYFIDGDKHCTRLNIEEWAINKGNPMAAGYDGDQLCDELKSYAYLNPITYKTTEGSPAQEKEVTIRPTVDKGNIAVFYVDKPADISALGTDDINLPSSVMSLLWNKALQYIAYKQGDQTTVFQVSASDILTLVQTIS